MRKRLSLLEHADYAVQVGRTVVSFHLKVKKNNCKNSCFKYVSTKYFENHFIFLQSILPTPFPFSPLHSFSQPFLILLPLPPSFSSFSLLLPPIKLKLAQLFSLATLASRTQKKRWNFLKRSLI